MYNIIQFDVRSLQVGVDCMYTEYQFNRMTRLMSCLHE